MTVKRKPNRAIKTKDKPIKTLEIEVGISKYFNVRKCIIVPNISWGLLSHEVDMLIIRKSGIAIEVEIKISLQDFKADLDKKHHHKEELNRITYFYYAMPEILYNKCKNMIPENAGVIVCSRYHNNWTKKDTVVCRTVKDAVKIKDARKLTIDEQFKTAILGTMRIFNLKTKIITLQNKLVAPIKK